MHWESWNCSRGKKEQYICQTIRCNYETWLIFLPHKFDSFLFRKKIDWIERKSMFYIVSILQAAFDLFNAINWLPRSYFKYLPISLWSGEKLPPICTGLFGALSSLCSIYKQRLWLLQLLLTIRKNVRILVIKQFMNEWIIDIFCMFFKFAFLCFHSLPASNFFFLLSIF